MTVSTTTRNFNFTEINSFFTLLQAVFTSAGFPAPYQAYTTTEPYCLVYQFDTNNFLAFSNIYSGYAEANVYRTWNTGTRTGTGNSSASVPWNSSTGIMTCRTLSENSGAIGIVALYDNSNTTMYNSFGFIKVTNKASYYTSTYATNLILLSNTNEIYAASTYKTYSTSDKFGSLAYPDIISKNNIALGSGTTGNLGLISPVLLYSGGYPIGTSDPKVVYSPNLNQRLGLRLVVTAGVEEYIYAGCDLAVRDI